MRHNKKIKKPNYIPPSSHFYVSLRKIPMCHCPILSFLKEGKGEMLQFLNSSRDEADVLQMFITKSQLCSSVFVQESSHRKLFGIHRDICKEENLNGVQLNFKYKLISHSHSNNRFLSHQIVKKRPHESQSGPNQTHEGKIRGTRIIGFKKRDRPVF